MLRPMSINETLLITGDPQYETNNRIISFLDSWYEENIKAVIIPQLARMETWNGRVNSRGGILANKLLHEPLIAAFEEIDEKGIMVNVVFWGGSMSLRTRRTNDKLISLHALGLAFDLNPALYPMGRPEEWPAPGVRGNLDLVIPVFKRHGIVNGGAWPVPDLMHFELGINAPIITGNESQAKSTIREIETLLAKLKTEIK